VEGDSIPPEQDDGHKIPPQLREALAGLDPGALPALAEFIALHRQFPA